MGPIHKAEACTRVALNAVLASGTSPPACRHQATTQE